MLYQHTYSTTEGPVAGITSLSVVHETERSPTPREKWIDRLLFWRLLFPRMKPRRVNWLEMIFPSVTIAKVDIGRANDGSMTMESQFTAHFSGDRITAIPVSGNPSIDLLSFMRS